MKECVCPIFYDKPDILKGVLGILNNNNQQMIDNLPVVFDIYVSKFKEMRNPEGQKAILVSINTIL